MSISSPNKQIEKKKKKKKNKKKKQTTEAKVAKKKKKLYLGNVAKLYKEAEEPVLTVEKKKRIRRRSKEQRVRKV